MELMQIRTWVDRVYIRSAVPGTKKALCDRGWNKRISVVEGSAGVPKRTYTHLVVSNGGRGPIGYKRSPMIPRRQTRLREKTRGRSAPGAARGVWAFLEGRWKVEGPGLGKP